MRNTKRFAAMAIVATFGLVATACGDDEKKSTDTTSSCVETGELKLGVAFDTGGRGDGTFNDSAGRGADQAVCDLGATKQELEATVEDDRQPNLEALTAAGNNPVIAVGFAFGDAISVVSAANPDTIYGWVDGYLDLPNVKTLSFAEEQGSFLVGAAAALACGCDHIGFIGGQEIDLIKKFEAGYTAGAKQINPDITVEVQYLGAAGDNAAWGSPDKAKEIALGWYADGVEVIYTAAGGSGAGTIDAAVEADKWAIGVDSDQYLTATPEQQAHILTSMLKRVDVAVFQTAKAIQDGDLTGGFKVFDLSVDGVGYSTSGGYLDEFVTQLDDLKAQIVAGDIVVPTAP
ncbi:MAG: BMP family ABC transporter substrate-binding protein [Actinomycetia bacterium]|nr:BMP family ABC transporter substrate-binding protein [Actinomycetes bacterium]